MTHPLIQVQNLDVRFFTEEGETQAVNNVSFDIKRGEILGLVGESGSGKSVTAKSLMRLNPNNAVVSKNSAILLNINGQTHSVEDLRPRELRLVRGGAIGMIFQEPMASFAPALRVGEQIVETLQFHLKLSKTEARKRGIRLFERVGIPEPERRFDQYVSELSGGMRQRAMIAMALATEPKLLIADEPTTALDVTIQAQVLDLMLELRDELDMAILFITHDLGVIAQVAERVMVMQRGEVVERGQTRSVLTNPQHDYTKRLISTLPDIRNLPNAGRESSAPTVRMRGATVAYKTSEGLFGRKEFVAVKGATLDLPQGHIVGLVGESGSGKTSLGRAILQAAPITDGTIEHDFGGETFRVGELRGDQERRFRKHAQLIFQDPYGSLNPRMTVRDIIADPLEAMSLTKNRDETDQRVREIALKCRLDLDHLRRFPHAFSGGQRQRISIARALVSRPSLVIADEAVAALDVSIQAEILDLLKQLQTEMDLTILFISHDLSVIANLCDSVVVMRRGEIVEQGSVREIFLAPKQDYTRDLISAVPTLEKAFSSPPIQPPRLFEGPIASA